MLEPPACVGIAIQFELQFDANCVRSARISIPFDVRLLLYVCLRLLPALRFRDCLIYYYLRCVCELSMRFRMQQFG